jgi:hypothetical protein
MPVARRCFSRAWLASVCFGTLLVGGCAAHGPSILPAAAPVGAGQALSPPPHKPEIKAAAAAQPEESGATEQQGLVARQDAAWCRYLDARSKAKNAILLSPTVSGSIDQDQNASARISYDLVDIARAKLETRSADASCKKYYAADRITRMLYVTPQSLTYAGNMERANYLETQRGKLAAISKRIREHVQKGEMTVQLASGLNQYIETISSLEHQARNQARQRETVTLLNAGDAHGLDRDLSNAERDLQEIDRVSRSLEAVSVSLSAGVNRSGLDNDDNDDLYDEDSAYARLTVSYRLGALSPYRSRYEDVAEQARQEALVEQGHGSLWYTKEMAATVARVREGLLVQRERVNSAIAEARSNARNFSQGYEIELYQSRYRAEVDIIKLTADLRGIDGTLKDIDSVERKLLFR